MGTQTSCISHPANQRLVVLREDYLRICEGNHCAAALLNLFEHGHNRKLSNQKDALHANEVAEQHGERGTQDTSLLQWYNQQELEDGLLNLYKRMVIRKGLDIIVQKGYVSIHKNPTSRYHFDKTHYFRFHPEVVQSQLLDLFDELKIAHRRAENSSSSAKNSSSSAKNSSSRSLITPQIPDLDLPLSPTESSPRGEPLDVHAVSAGRKGQRRKTYFPTDPDAQATLRALVLDAAFYAWAREKGLTTDIAREWEHFRGKALAKGYQYVDWRQAFQNWLTSPLQIHGAAPAANSKTMGREDFQAEAAKFKGRI